MSNFKVPLIIFNLFKTGDGFFKSWRNLYRWSSFSLSGSYAFNEIHIRYWQDIYINLQLLNSLFLIYLSWFTCLKKLETVRVTGGNESNILLWLFPEDTPSFPLSPNVSPPIDPPVMDDAAQDDLLSLRSRDPKI